MAAEHLRRFLEGLGASAWGIADITGLHSLASTYPRAISLGLSYDAPAEYDEAAFHNVLVKKRDELDELVRSLTQFLQTEGVKYHVIPQARQDPDTLIGEFPHKLAATRAGMGWVGKNSLLVTREFGPRIRLSTVLLGTPLPADKPLCASRCGQCRLCVDACPYGFIKNSLWQPGIGRDSLVDVFGCSRKREESVPSIGRKHTCGLCLLACPFGRSDGRRRRFPG